MEYFGWNLRGLLPLDWCLWLDALQFGLEAVILADLLSHYVHVHLLGFHLYILKLDALDLPPGINELLVQVLNFSLELVDIVVIAFNWRFFRALVTQILLFNVLYNLNILNVRIIVIIIQFRCLLFIPVLT